jgi:hypothetical protein
VKQGRFAYGMAHAFHTSAWRHEVTKASTVLLALIAVVTWCAAPRSASASCASPTTTLLWSYPADGATDVPTDAVFWMVSGRQPVQATLDDEPLVIEAATEAAAVSSIDPGALAADTDYVLRVEYASARAVSPDAGAVATFEIAFHTGTAKRTQPSVPTVTAHHILAIDRPVPRCRDVAAAQGCFDTGNAAIEFDVSADRDAIAWLVQAGSTEESTLWPNRCGQPTLIIRTQNCIDIRALGVGGKLSAPTRYCGAVQTPGGSAWQLATPKKTNNGCSTSSLGANGGHASQWTYVALFALLSCARRQTLKTRRSADSS